MANLHRFIPIVHVVAVIFAIIELGLTAYMSSFYRGWYGLGYYSPSQVNFMIFNSVWSLLVLAYVGLTPLYFANVFHSLAALALNLITTVFWFAGAIALAVLVGGPYQCDANTYCGASEAAVAFGFFLWALFTFLAALDGINFLRSRGHDVSKPQANPGA
ncbi:membrane-associating domain-containing protein [Durotheca rogersii]|uniref:membrane-associating domain-containing protein n=1 Tax=Durotheca rogersii TaxID=419775 RepID=UPI00221F6271|nr:membrane-associating domain-containing protein [Durotheca rogersii]KAI5857406.1 membrane-associating domain-containing protein [Durotheca rogersii]